MTDPKSKAEELRDEFLRELAAMEDGAESALEKVLAALPPREPDPSLRARLMLSSQQTHRFEEMIDMVATDADVSIERAGALLLAIDEPASWQPGPVPSVSLLHFDGGPKTARAITGFVRIAPGGQFPEHDHLGEEIVIVLQGECRDTHSGAVYGRGDRVVTHPGTKHAIEVTSDIPFIYTAIVHEGLTIDGREFLYDDPDM